MGSKSKRHKTRLRGIALPTEHGSWGILLEPIVASLAVAFSAAGIFIALTVIGAFLLRQPVKILVTDLSAGRRLPQTETASRFLFGFLAICFVGLAGSLALSEAADLIPLFALIPFGAFQIYSDVARKTRQLLPELAGSAAISASAPAIALAAGWSAAESIALWAIFISRSIPSIVYIRQRLRLEKGKDFNRLAPAVLHVAGLAAVAGLAYYRLAPVAICAVFAFLLYRAVSGLSESRRRMKAMQLGIRETVYGAVLVVSLIIGHFLQL